MKVRKGPAPSRWALKGVYPTLRAQGAPPQNASAHLGDSPSPQVTRLGREREDQRGTRPHPSMQVSPPTHVDNA
eukprot:7481811-Pyramimonas_sp.AAC.1